MALATSYKSFDEVKELFDPDTRIEQEAVFCEKFDKISSFHIVFHTSCICLLIFQASIFLSLVMSNPKSPYVAALLFSCILTLFSYLILLFYYRTKKPQDFLDLRRFFVQACRKQIASKKPFQDEHLFLAKAAESLTNKIGKNQFYFKKQSSMGALLQLLRFKDVEKMQELLMYAAIQEHIEIIKKDPLDGRTHLSLAKAYLSMVKLYQSPLEESFSRIWIVQRILQSEKRQRRVEAAITLAMEELKIGLNSFPDDTWALLELANCYKAINDLHQELSCLVKLQQFIPNDETLLLRLGKLFFLLGKTAEGLDIFSKLKNLNVHLSFELIDSYNAYLKNI
jgi:hypothetical protein